MARTKYVPQVRALTVARHPGNCAECRAVIRVGDKISHVKGVTGWVHGYCVESVEARVRSGSWEHCGGYTKLGRPCLVYVPAGERCHHHREPTRAAVLDESIR